MSEPEPSVRAEGRVALATPLGAQIGADRVQILDLSLCGARVSHSSILPPNDSCPLHFALEDQPLTLQGRLVWSSVVRRSERPGSYPVFNSGLAFENLSPATQALLARHLGPLPAADAGEDPLRWQTERATKAAGDFFSEDAVRAAWAWAGRQCECVQDGHGHPNRCGSQLAWSRRSTNRAGGWEARRRQPPMPDGTEAENCEIVCWPCYELDLPVPLRE